MLSGGVLFLFASAKLRSELTYCMSVTNIDPRIPAIVEYESKIAIGSFYPFAVIRFNTLNIGSTHSNIGDFCNLL